MNKIDKKIFEYVLKNKPGAVAEIKGGSAYPKIEGVAEFYKLPHGVLIVSDIENLPQTDTNIFAFHIHEGGSCEDDFAMTGGHYNPKNLPHPKHSGDMAPLFAFDGDAFSVFYTQRVNLDEIIGKTLVIHENPDDFTSQPAGNSGQKIACGVIRKV